MRAERIKLVPERLERVQRAAKRAIRRHPSDDGTFPPYVGPPKSVRNVNGYAARAAVAQFLGLRRLPAGVRSRWAPRPVLHVQKGQHPGWTICVLVTGRADGDLELWGWIRGREAPRLGKRREDGSRVAWAVPADRLHPMSELADAIRDTQRGRGS